MQAVLIVDPACNLLWQVSAAVRDLCQSGVGRTWSAVDGAVRVDRTGKTTRRRQQWHSVRDVHAGQRHCTKTLLTLVRPSLLCHKSTRCANEKQSRRICRKGLFFNGAPSTCQMTLLALVCLCVLCRKSTCWTVALHQDFTCTHLCVFAKLSEFHREPSFR